MTLGNNERCNLVVWIFFISRSVVRFSHQIICIQSDFLDACSRFLSEIADGELVWERGFFISVAWIFSLGEPFIIIYLFPGKWWNFDLNKQGGGETWLRRKMATSKNKYFSMALTTWWKDSSGCQEWRKIDGNILFFSAADLPQECRTRRSYSLDRIHLYDSYFPFPFQNKYLLLSLSNDFLPRISLRKLFWPEFFVAINLLANDPECNLSRQWHPN